MESASRDNPGQFAHLNWHSLRVQLALGVALLVGLAISLLTVLATGQLETEFSNSIRLEHERSAHAIAQWLRLESSERLQALQVLGEHAPETIWTDQRQIQEYIDEEASDEHLDIAKASMKELKQIQVVLKE